MLKSFLVILASCSAPVDAGPVCVASETEATLYTYSRLVDCVRDREYFTKVEGVEATCDGEAFDPRQWTLG